MFADVDDGRLAFAGTALILGNETHDLVQVEDRAVEFVALEVISPHPDFAEVTRMVLVEVDSVMMLTSGVSATSRMFPEKRSPTKLIAASKYISLQKQSKIQKRINCKQ